MAEKRDYYEVLGVSKTATDAEIKKAFRQQAKKYHPDIHPGDKECEEKFKEAQEAYAVLSDPDKRRQYDQFGHAAFDGTGGGAGGFDFSGMDMGDIFGDIFGDFFGGGRSSGRRNGPAQGANVRLSVRISFEEAIFGCTKELEFNYKETCSTCGGNGAKPGTSPETCTQCNGTGKVVRQSQSLFGVVQNVTTCPSCGGSGKVVKDKCPTCHGTGYNTKKVRKTVEIPAGIDNGQCVRIREYGEPGINGGPRGDLLVEVIVSGSRDFERQDVNIFSKASISYAIAALGGDIRIKTVDGSICVRSLTSFHLVHHAYVSPYKHVRQYENHQKYDDKHLEKGFYRVSFFIFHFVFTFFVRLTVTAFIVFAKLQVIISSLG